METPGCCSAADRLLIGTKPSHDLLDFLHEFFAGEIALLEDFLHVTLQARAVVGRLGGVQSSRKSRSYSSWLPIQNQIRLSSNCLANAR